MKLISKIKPSFNSISFKSKNFKATAFLLALAAISLIPDVSIAVTATGGNTFEDSICNALGYITGPLGAGIATLAIVSLGIGAMLGKIAWTTVLICCAGIGAIFGGTEIVEKISGVASCVTTL